MVKGVDGRENKEKERGCTKKTETMNWDDWE